MIGFLRVAAMAAGMALVWLVVASQVPNHARLPLSGVVVGAVVSQPFGCSSLQLEPYDPFCPSKHVHTGIDLAAPAGTFVHSASTGTARVGYDPGGAGRYVLVTVDAHTRVFYCHLSDVGVTAGQSLSPGQVIGAVGATGMATGPHLHLEVQVDGLAIDPSAWLLS